jgi:hypothetical protein
MREVFFVIFAAVDEDVFIVIGMSEYQTMPSGQQAHLSDVAIVPRHPFNETENIALHFGERPKKKMTTRSRR